MKRIALILLCILLLLAGCASGNEFDKLSEAERVLVDWGGEPLISYGGNGAIHNSCHESVNGRIKVFLPGLTGIILKEKKPLFQ